MAYYARSLDNSQAMTIDIRPPITGAVAGDLIDDTLAKATASSTKFLGIHQGTMSGDTLEPSQFTAITLINAKTVFRLKYSAEFTITEAMKLKNKFNITAAGTLDVSTSASGSQVMVAYYDNDAQWADCISAI